MTDVVTDTGDHEAAPTRMQVSFTHSGAVTFTFHQAPVQSEERP